MSTMAQGGKNDTSMSSERSIHVLGENEEGVHHCGVLGYLGRETKYLCPAEPLVTIRLSENTSLRQ